MAMRACMHTHRDPLWGLQLEEHCVVSCRAVSALSQSHRLKKIMSEPGIEVRASRSLQLWPRLSPHLPVVCVSDHPSFWNRESMNSVCVRARMHTSVYLSGANTADRSRLVFWQLPAERSELAPGSALDQRRDVCRLHAACTRGRRLRPGSLAPRFHSGPGRHQIWTKSLPALSQI